MYKVLVCDDEKWIRKGIAKKIEEMSLPILSVYDAGDAKEAKRLIKKERPHIVIADICLEESNGLDLIGEVSSKYQDIRFIIISGYSEFSYAEQGIKLGVDAYLLKPISTEELEETLANTIEKYEMTQDFLQSRLIHTELSWQNKKYQIEMIFNQIFRESNVECQRQLVEDAKKIHSDWKRYCQCILLQIEESSYENSGFSKQDIELLKYGIKNIVLELAGTYDENIEVIRDMEHLQRMIIIVWNDNLEKISLRTMQFVTRISYVIREELNLNLTISVSLVHDDIVRDMYLQAQKAMHKKFIDGVNEIYHYSKCFEDSQDIQIPFEQMGLLAQNLKKNDIENAKKAVHEIIFGKDKNIINSEYIFCIYLNILNIILNSCDEAIYVFNSSKINFMDIDNFEKFENNEEIEEFINKIIIQICNLKTDISSVADCKSLMEKVKKYINRNYMNKISLNDIAKLFNINYSYLSTIFKEQVGVPLTQYLRLVRIEKACNMLKDAQVNLKIIANSVGFDDVMYFYRVFKKCKGVTPTEYRKSHKK